MKAIFTIIGFLFLTGCGAPRITVKQDHKNMFTGEQFYDSVASATRPQREDLAKTLLLIGNMPSFLKRFVPVYLDTVLAGKRYRMKLFVMPDYLAIGTDENWARIPLTPMAAQKVADAFHAFLPTPKIVDLIYRNATVKLRPMPMFAFRDSAITMFHHHLIIEGQRQQRKGIIAGVKKDVVITDRLSNKPGRVAIYGWHRLNGQPIQPLYTGHTETYVDYSHGIRLVYEIVRVNGKKMPFTDILKDSVIRSLLTDDSGSYSRYQQIAAQE